MSTVSIILPILNGAKTLPGLLEGLKRQVHPILELIAVDSSSTDSSVKILESYERQGLPLRLQHIDLHDFSHSRTRNQAAEMAKGDILVFIVQDAVPADEHWLGNLVKPFENIDVACAISRHIARPHATPLVKAEIDRCFDRLMTPGNPFTRQNRFDAPEEYVKRPEWFWFNSDVSSAVRRSVFCKVQFKSVPYAEDQILGKDLIEAGYTKVYVDNSLIIHSHQYNLRSYFRRQFDENRGLRMSTGVYTPVKLYDFLPRIVWRWLADIRYLKQTQAEKRLYWTAYALAYNAARVAGLWCGQYFAALPPAIQVKCSLEKKAYSRDGRIIAVRKSKTARQVLLGE